MVPAPHHAAREPPVGQARDGRETLAEVAGIEPAMELLDAPLAARRLTAHETGERVRQLRGVTAPHRDPPRKAADRRAAAQHVHAPAEGLNPPSDGRAAESRSPSIRATNSSLAETTISAAADGVGARRSATKSAIVTSVSWPTAEMTGTGQSGNRARDDLVERPEILDRAAAARDDDDVHARDAPDGVEGALHSQCCSLLAARSVASAGSPAARCRVPAAPEHLDDVADRGAVERCHDADFSRECRQRPFARGIEQPLGLKPLLQLIEGELERAQAVRLDGPQTSSY